MKTPFIILVLLVAAQPATAILRNVGPPVPATFAGNHLTPMSSSRPSGVLYAPSEADDPAYRAGIAAQLTFPGPVDYYDARYGTPSVSQLSSYSAVHTWANYAYLDPVGFGNNLAQFADNGGLVVLGAFCTYCSGNCLQGEIMTSAYCPVYSPSLSNHFSPAGWSGDDADACEYLGVAPGWQAFYRDYLALQGSGTRRGTFTDGEIACAVGPGYLVHYVNGSGGSPILWDANIEHVVANACNCAMIGYGACCFPNGSCEVVGPAGCDYGYYMGDFTTCDPDPCLVPLGACCRNGNCQVMDEPSCALWGVYQGDGTPCWPNPCQVPTPVRPSTWSEIKASFR